MSTVYLMSGDEDVREGVVEAQEFGVAVILLGIEPRPGQSNQAATLVREADDVITLSRSDCRPRIPQSIDIWLVKNAAARFEDPLSEDAKHQVRAGFWRGIETATTGDPQ